MVAQKLYESGLITYMRTDSVNLSEYATEGSKVAIAQMMGDQYVHPRHFATKTKGAQEAHEAIRPTYMENQTIEGSAQERKLYDLVWKRTMPHKWQTPNWKRQRQPSVSATVTINLPLPER